MQKVTKTPICINAGPFGRRCFGGVMTTVSLSEVSSLPWRSGWLPPRGKASARPRPSHRYSSVWSRVTTQFARSLSGGWFEPRCARLWSPGRLQHTTPLCHSPLPQDTIPCGVTHRRRQQSFLAGFQAARLSRSFDSRWGWRLLHQGGSVHGVNWPRLCRDALTKVADNAPLSNPGWQPSAHRRLQAARLSRTLHSRCGSC